MLEQTRRAIVLAAGMGSRLVSGEDLPKPLKPVAGIPLLVRILRTLQSEGIHDAVIVVGHRGEQLRAALEAEPSLALTLHFVENPEYDKKNGVSLLAAAPFVDGDCLLTMADHLYSPEVVRSLYNYDLPQGCCALAVDRDIERCFDLDDATKVVTGAGRIRAIGKELPLYDALDTGVFRIGPSLIAQLERLYAERGDCSLSEGIESLSREGRMYACDVGDARWIDVDTPEAARRAEAMLHVFGDGLGDEPAGGGRLDPEAMELFAPTWVRGAQPYNEDHFELASRRGDVARMMSNESPYKPSARVLEAIMSAAMAGNEYPRRAADLREKLGAREGLDGDHALLGAGSAELIDLTIRTFVAPGEEVVISVPTFSMYEARTRTVGGIPIMLPMTADGGFDVSAMIAAITERTKLIFVCTPNNPTGNNIDESDLRRLLRLGLPTVIDEAYFELRNDEKSLVHLLHEFPNALILRTFSKAFGLAGIRVGYALGNPSLIRLLSRVKVPWNVSTLAIAAACAALDDVIEQRRRLTALRQGRQLLERELGRVPGLEVIPCEGNFVLVDAAGTGLSVETVVEGMLARGIFIRSLRSHRAGRGLVRITVGSSEQNRRCIHSMRELVLAPARPRPSAPELM
jgi:histidinol-phosphate aminotransferase